VAPKSDQVRCRTNSLIHPADAAARLRDRGAAEGERIRFSPTILPPYARRTCRSGPAAAIDPSDEKPDI